MNNTENYILGLDLGTNSIGWALILIDKKKQIIRIIALGSRIIPMDSEVLSNFEKGISISKTAKRTEYRGKRRLYERHHLRRERLLRVLHTLGFLPKLFDSQIDFEKKLGKFINHSEPKLPYNEKEFIFKNSFEEMVADFKVKQPQLFYTKSNGTKTIIPYDWTIYYLRKKALTHKIEKEELAWILLNFNKKRGYYQLRGEEENTDKLVEYHTLLVTDITVDKTPNKEGELWYSIHLENGWIYRRSSTISLENWIGTTKEFIVTTEITKKGEIKRTFRAPEEKDWTLIKKKTEDSINKYGKPIGTYIYDNLLQNPNQKIIGKLIRTIERKYYREELTAILKKQIELQPELFNDEIFLDCIKELYKNNTIHQKFLKSKDFVHLFVNDIIFYQRPLKSQKSNIADCSLEFHTYMDKSTGKQQKVHLKVISKSNPHYQEFRVLQWLYNLKIYTKDEDRDVTSQFITSTEDREELYELLMSKKEVDNDTVIAFLLKKVLKKEYPNAKDTAINKELKKRKENYRWNYIYDSEQKESKKYPMNETGYEIRKRLDNIQNIPENFLTKDIVYKLWHILYSVKDKYEYEKAIKKFANKHNINEEAFVENFKNFKPFANDYGNFSEKAIKKLLPLMRFGKYWDINNISTDTQNRITDIINGVDNEDVKLIVREQIEKHQLKNEYDFQGLPLWLAQYVVYNRHSEAGEITKWKSIEDLNTFLKNFKQNSLRNPIVEQVILETLRVVKDIWSQYGKGKENFFNEIHIELGRELKKNNKERKAISDSIEKNENTNLRIKYLLTELKNDGIQDIRPYSPNQQEILKLFEEGALLNEENIDKDIIEISKKAEPTKKEIERYKHWLDQKYISPYTGQPISLSKLFTHEYEIEHILPKKRYYDDSFNNKVICESIINKKKDNSLAMEFINNCGGHTIIGDNGKEYRILSKEEYTNLIKRIYAKNKKKRENLLATEIPEKMISRQLNDTRYISKFVSQTLSNLVRKDEKDEGVNSINIIHTNGVITNILKQDWGLNDIWNQLILPRFERLNKLKNTDGFISYSEKHQKNIPTIPSSEKESKNFQKKRIDHRHHAMDALIIACTTKEHINYINNINSAEKNASKKEKENARFDLRSKLCYKKYNSDNKDNYNWCFKKPWETFTQDAKNILETTIISFKQNLKTIKKSTNYYEKYVEENGKFIKKKVKQDGENPNWTIRKPLHKDTIYGKVELNKKLSEGEIFTANRKSIESLTKKNIEYIKDIDSKKIITDFGIKKILRNYLNHKDIETFTTEDVSELNKNIAQFNNGKDHKPIHKVRIYENSNHKFKLGERGTKNKKFVETAKGTNLYFNVYQNVKGERNYRTIPLTEVIENHKQGNKFITPNIYEKQETYSLLFTLSPGDLVYVPEENEIIEHINFSNLNKEQKNRIYKVVSFSEKDCFFIKQNIAKSIINKQEFSSSNKMEKDLNGIMIKSVCIKLSVDRLGNICKANS